ncbi:uncharacterized protein LOC102151574 isoform X1 [Canis lupus familiaris]|uniref:uncharacterized protein LOC102151574 isoform X1 n=1 Tax=Canis lupus familiaris TaxID=9615 RepID=UPI0003AE67F7|nr:uncharacterized protein LOC102151574 isoform X1 [Canis lupus familiaris]XP_038291979.1 uncharacterized protein LOC102151574 isoform X1 [Canis lupus familiaris]|eukprot:XP_005636044.1 uncharacterized protein LOC102151574 isoform X1 [Canis lupus familiaris]
MDAAPGLTAATPGLSPRSLSRSGALGPTVGQHEEQKGDCGTQDSASPAGAELCTCRHQNRDWVAGTGPSSTSSRPQALEDQRRVQSLVTQQQRGGGPHPGRVSRPLLVPRPPCVAWLAWHLLSPTPWPVLTLALRTLSRPCGQLPVLHPFPPRGPPSPQWPGLVASDTGHCPCSRRPRSCARAPPPSRPRLLPGLRPGQAFNAGSSGFSHRSAHSWVLVAVPGPW